MGTRDEEPTMCFSYSWRPRGFVPVCHDATSLYPRVTVATV